MKVFVTGATGWVGSEVVKELLRAGHEVSGLARDAAKAQWMIEAGTNVVIGTVDDLALLRAEAGKADGVIHTAFNHDFSKFAENVKQDERAIAALGEALVGTDKPMLVTAGFGGLAPDHVAVETDFPGAVFPRRSDAAAKALREQGVKVSVIRLAPSVHGLGDHGFVPLLINLAREKGVAGYLGDGQNRWPGVHVKDAAVLYRLALEDGAREFAYHVADEEGVAFKDIATVIGRGLGVPVEARGAEHFGWFATFAGMDMSASSAHTRMVLGWQPKEAGFLIDIGQAGYYAK